MCLLRNFRAAELPKEVFPRGSGFCVIEKGTVNVISEKYYVVISFPSFGCVFLTAPNSESDFSNEHHVSKFLSYGGNDYCSKIVVEY